MAWSASTLILRCYMLGMLECVLSEQTTVVESVSVLASNACFTFERATHERAISQVLVHCISNKETCAMCALLPPPLITRA